MGREPRQDADAPRSAAAVYGLTLAAVALAWAARRLCDPLLGNQLPYVSFAFPAMAAALLGGLWPGLIATVLGWLLGTFFFVAPRYTFLPPPGPYLYGLAMYLVVCLAMTGFGEGVRRARRRFDRQQRAALDQVYSTLESIADGFVAVDADWRFTYFNAEAERIYGMARGELLGRPLWEAVPAVAGSVFEAPFRKAMSERVPIQVEGPYQSLGEWFEVKGFPVRGGGVSFYFRDVSARRRVEFKSRSNEERFRLAADAVNGLIYDYDMVTGRVERTRGLQELFGYRPEEASPTAEWWTQHIHPDGLARMSAEFEARSAAAGVIRSEYRVRHRDGRWVYVEDRAVIARDPSGKPVRMIGCTVDVTERRRAEEALRQSEEKYRFLVDTVPALVWSCKPDGSTDYHNSRWFEYTGLPREGGTEEDWRGVCHPDDVDRAMARWMHSVRTGEPYRVEYRLRRAADGQYRWFLAEAAAMRDPGVGVVRWFGTCTDIHEEKRAQQALREADRRKDEFIATLAHELRNPLAPIRNAVQILKAKGPPDPDLVWGRDVIERQVGQMARLLEDLLDVSRITLNKLELRKATVSLADVVEIALETSRPLIDAGGHELAVELPPGPVHLEADAVRLAQVFSNLLTNAAKYTERGGRIALSAAVRSGEVIVFVKDTGIGIDPEMMPRLFQMFSQAAPALERSQGGLGIGLSLVKGLVEMHGGRIEARSEGRGRGAEFVVTLPVISGFRLEISDLKTVPAGLQSEIRNSRSEIRLRVLIADDNRDAADSLAIMLEMLGHQVRTARDGQEAVEAAGEFRPDVALLDIGMPRLNGYDAARRIRAEPWGGGITLVALTGWGQEEDRRRSREAGFDRHLVKPVDPAALQDLLQTRSLGEKLPII